MTRLRIAACLALPLLGLTACAPAPTPEEIAAKAKAATASVLGVDASAVTISNQQDTYTKRTWRAEAGGKTFECDAERSFALPACTAVS